VFYAELNGKTIAETPNSVVPQGLLEEIWCLRSHDISWDDVIQRLRLRTVPSGYTYCTWHAGKSLLYSTGIQILSVCNLHAGVTETFDDQLRSILAQLDYANIISKYEENGVPFRTHMYVPEVHPATGQVFYEREDDAHLLKVNILI